MLTPVPRRLAPARARRGRARAAVIVAALALFGQLLGLAHLFLIEHARCPEHGDTVHVRRGGEEAHAAPAGRAGAVAGADGDVRAGGAADHGDDHCQLWTERRDRAATPSLACAHVPTFAQLDAIDPHPAMSPPRPLYWLAPKLGPPAA